MADGMHAYLLHLLKITLLSNKTSQLFIMRGLHAYSYAVILLLAALSLQADSTLIQPHVVMVRNTLSYRFLALDGPTIMSTTTQNSASKLQTHREQPT